MTSKDTRGFSVLQENIRALDPNKQTNRWMAGRPQMCWKCQQEKRLLGGSIKMFGTVRRFICVDCVLTKKAELAKAKQELK
jgi:hypothetical protein